VAVTERPAPRGSGTLSLTVPRIRCEGCAETIRAALGRLPGVSTVRVAVTTREVHVDLDPVRTDEAAVREALGRAGYPPA
jgi:copper chaperone CopZ